MSAETISPELPLNDQYAALVDSLNNWSQDNQPISYDPSSADGIYTTAEGGKLKVSNGRDEVTIRETVGDRTSRVIIKRRQGREGLNFCTSLSRDENSTDPNKLEFGYWDKEKTPRMGLVDPNLTHAQVFEGARGLVSKLASSKRAT